jgi:CelD/BcsL family acetyltransferase involved in cellulose biosynthesis
MNWKQEGDRRVLRITECNEPDAVAALGPVWRALQARCPQTTPWQTWEWNEAWWRHFGARKRPRIILVYRDLGELVGIAPLYTGHYLLTPLHRLAWIGTGPSDYLGPLALPEEERAVCAALLRHIEHESSGWDIADLQQLRPDSALCKAASEGREGIGRRVSGVGNGAYDSHCKGEKKPEERLWGGEQAMLPMEPCPYLPLPTTWEALTARLGKKMRSNLGYYERLIQRSFGQVEYQLADSGTLDEGMTALFDLHQRRWNARKLPGVLGTGRVQAFHREVAARFLDQGWLRLHLLRLDGRIRAALYCMAREGRTFYYLGGFALDLSRYSLGTVLTARAIQTAIAEGHTEFDFLRGHEPYKYRWLPEERVNQRLLLLRSQDGLDGLRSRAGLTLNRAEHGVIVRAKAFVERHGNKEATVAVATAQGEAARAVGAKHDTPPATTRNGRVVR